ncbi:hypothetical protein E0E54_19725 [Azotobacter chroococcum]|uniref:hypothetical protein n=1 Tax=Azotobacter chroococcum TaxID=353 RepID=UPI00103F4223|nr:hypothetical protein [Azotobacter chroococcum]TBW32243.1 hypothetical protein E0E54_19725 [Azotobacter chroococcum]
MLKVSLNHRASLTLLGALASLSVVPIHAAPAEMVSVPAFRNELTSLFSSNQYALYPGETMTVAVTGEIDAVVEYKREKESGLGCWDGCDSWIEEHTLRRADPQNLPLLLSLINLKEPHLEIKNWPTICPKPFERKSLTNQGEVKADFNFIADDKQPETLIVLRDKFMAIDYSPDLGSCPDSDGNEPDGLYTISLASSDDLAALTRGFILQARVADKQRVVAVKGVGTLYDGKTRDFETLQHCEAARFGFRGVPGLVKSCAARADTIYLPRARNECRGQEGYCSRNAYTLAIRKVNVDARRAAVLAQLEKRRISAAKVEELISYWLRYEIVNGRIQERTTDDTRKILAAGISKHLRDFYNTKDVVPDTDVARLFEIALELDPTNNDLRNSQVRYLIRSSSLSQAKVVGENTLKDLASKYDEAKQEGLPWAARQRLALGLAEAASNMGEIWVQQKASVVGRDINVAVSLNKEAGIALRETLFDPEAVTNPTATEELRRAFGRTQSNVARLNMMIRTTEHLLEAEQALREARSFFPRALTGDIVGIAPDGRYMVSAEYTTRIMPLPVQASEKPALGYSMQLWPRSAAIRAPLAVAGDGQVLVSAQKSGSSQASTGWWRSSSDAVSIEFLDDVWKLGREIRLLSAVANENAILGVEEETSGRQHLVFLEHNRIEELATVNTLGRVLFNSTPTNSRRLIAFTEGALWVKDSTQAAAVELMPKVTLPGQALALTAVGPDQVALAWQEPTKEGKARIMLGHFSLDLTAKSYELIPQSLVALTTKQAVASLPAVILGASSNGDTLVAWVGTRVKVWRASDQSESDIVIDAGNAIRPGIIPIREGFVLIGRKDEKVMVSEVSSASAKAGNLRPILTSASPEMLAWMTNDSIVVASRSVGARLRILDGDDGIRTAWTTDVDEFDGEAGVLVGGDEVFVRNLTTSGLIFQHRLNSDFLERIDPPKNTTIIIEAYASAECGIVWLVSRDAKGNVLTLQKRDTTESCGSSSKVSAPKYTTIDLPSSSQGWDLALTTPLDDSRTIETLAVVEASASTSPGGTTSPRRAFVVKRSAPGDAVSVPLLVAPDARVVGIIERPTSSGTELITLEHIDAETDPKIVARFQEDKGRQTEILFGLPRVNNVRFLSNGQAVFARVTDGRQDERVLAWKMNDGAFATLDCPLCDKPQSAVGDDRLWAKATPVVGFVNAKRGLMVWPATGCQLVARFAEFAGGTTLQREMTPRIVPKGPTVVRDGTVIVMSSATRLEAWRGFKDDKGDAYVPSGCVPQRGLSKN